MTNQPTEPVAGPQPPEAPHRRIAVLPVALAAGGVLLAAVFGLVVAGLAGQSVTAGPSPASTPPAAPLAPAPAAVEPVATEAPRPAAGPNECVDARADGQGVDIDSVALSVEDDRLRVVFVLTQPLPEDGEASLEISADSGDARYQLAALWSDGDLDEFFAYRLSDENDSDDRDRDGDGDRGPGRSGDEGERSDLKKRDIVDEGTVIVATFPKQVLERLGDSFLWYAYATADGQLADSCSLADGSLVPFER